jgi:predicted acyltransferase
MHQNKTLNQPSKRLLSVDSFRGITMFFLIGPLYDVMRRSDNGLLASIGWQFEHRYWHGLTLYDFIEPFFMFIVGVAIPLSVMSRIEKGQPWKEILMHVLRRSAILFLLGIFIYSVGAGKPVFRLWNVLTQLSFAYLLTFALLRTAIHVQVAVSFLLLLISFFFYVFWPVEGFNHPYVADQNFGSWFDLRTMGVLESDHWVAFNFLPTAAYTIWGAIAGTILRRDSDYRQKLKIFLMAGIIGVVGGLLLDPVIPMIKRIATASVVLETGGWCFIALAFSYWLIDIRRVQKLPFFFAIVGMNPLFIYMFSQLGGTALLSDIARPLAYGLFFRTNETTIVYASGVLTWVMLWYLCFWLYRHRIFFKI